MATRDDMISENRWYNTKRRNGETNWKKFELLKSQKICNGVCYVFLTYGDLRFRKSRARIAREANALRFFDSVIVETESVIKERPIRKALRNKKFKKTFNARRGGGYWMWKPYVILKALSHLNENDILIYSDAGCTIPNCEYTREKLSEYIGVVSRSDWGVLAFRNPYIESRWTKGDVFKHFHALENKNITNTRQFTANRIIFKKNEHSLKLVKLWWDTAREHTRLFDDSKSSCPNLPGHIQNRHDQSIWSVICKTHGVEEEYNWGSIPIWADKIRE